LSAWSETPEPDYVPTVPLEAEQASWIDSLFANMMTVIDQSLFHAFVQRHHGNYKCADIAWEISGAAMMYATELTQRLAARGLAAAPLIAASSANSVAMPILSSNPETAKSAD